MADVDGEDKGTCDDVDDGHSDDADIDNNDDDDDNGCDDDNNCKTLFVLGTGMKKMIQLLLVVVM